MINIANPTKERYVLNMYSETYYIVYPEGDIQEVPNTLTINQLVDMNGFPLPLPLKTNKQIVYRISQISKKEYRGGCETFYYLEQLTADELIPYVRF